MKELILLTKADLIDILAEGTGLTKVETGAVVDGLFATMRYALKKGDLIDIRGFGRFKVVQRKERIARNPKTGAEIFVAARKTAVFRCSKHLRDSINEPFEENDQFELKR
jgi:nucleoid DNA-binding protein